MFSILHKDENMTIMQEDNASPANVYRLPKKEDGINEGDILVIKIGSEERPASQEDIKNIVDVLEKVKNDPSVTLVTHHCIQFETIPRTSLGGTLIMAMGSQSKVKKLDEQGG